MAAAFSTSSTRARPRNEFLPAASAQRRRVLLDDPLEAMDRTTADALVGWIDAWVSSGAAVVVAGHELQRFAAHAVRAAAVRDGRIVVVEPLPADPVGRLAGLEALARR